MRKSNLISALAVVAISCLAAAAGAATITIVNIDGAGEGFNDPTVVAPVGGNPGTTLGAQRLIVFQTAADEWGALLVSDIEIKVNAKFDPLYCTASEAVLGSAGATTVHRDFVNAPLTGHWYSSALANALSGSDLNGTQAEISATFNSDIDDNAACLGGIGWYYGLDGNPGSQEHLYPVILHELGHGLGFQNFANESTGILNGGFPDQYTYYTYDESTGLTWDQMTAAQRVASAINTGQVVWDGPEGQAAAQAWLAASDADFVVNSPAPIAATYVSTGAGFGASGTESDGFTGALELANDGTGSPTEACNPLVGFTPGNVAFIDRGTCDFSLKAYNAEQAGATGAVIANNQGGTALVNMAAATNADLVTIPVIAITQNDGNTIRPYLDGVTFTFNVNSIWGIHAAGFPLLYAPNPVEMGSSISHWDVSMFADALMEPIITPYLYTNVDMTTGVYKDIGWTVVGSDTIFTNGFESGNTTAWDVTYP